LLSNAAKYNRPGGQVQVHAHADTVDGQRQVLIEVADTGLGMAPQQLAHLFEPFNRLGAERDGVEGTGIGLAIVKALVERMGGRVSVSSQPGEGSVFQVWLADGTDTPLPAATPSPSSRPVDLPTGPATSAAPRGTLLYIEDNPVNALIIAELIGRRSDLQLHLAADGEGGVQEALAVKPDLILLDMQLPDIDGHEVLRRLRAHPPTAHIPVIALSANAMPEDIERALQAGMSDYWTKPLDFRAFMASIEGLFGPAPA
jgi:CheY-like chemotaxis protein